MNRSLICYNQLDNKQALLLFNSGGGIKLIVRDQQVHLYLEKCFQLITPPPVQEYDSIWFFFKCGGFTSILDISINRFLWRIPILFGISGRGAANQTQQLAIMENNSNDIMRFAGYQSGNLRFLGTLQSVDITDLQIKQIISHYTRRWFV